nr:Transmembrane amino acid transporter protein [uncultured bacterium]
MSCAYVYLFIAVVISSNILRPLLVYVAGYLSFKTDTQGIILDNFTGNYSDIFKIMLIIHLVLYIPVDFMTMRYSLVKLSGNPTGQVKSDFGHVLVTIALLIGKSVLKKAVVETMLKLCICVQFL